MSTAVAVAFNLLVNAMVSFVWALALVALLLRLLSAGPGRTRLAILLVPFAKVLWDLARGVPEHSFLWVRALGAPRDLGAFQLGVGVAAPVRFFFRAVVGAYSHGVLYGESAADVAFRLVTRWAPAAPLALVVAWLAVAAARGARRLGHGWVARREIARLLAGARLVRSQKAGLRRARVYVSDAYRGAPFAGGIVRPYVLLPAELDTALSPELRDAALGHELAHVAHHDPLLLALLALFADVFWFLPGLGGLLTRVLGELELDADARAVREGSSAHALARALVEVGERLTAPSPAPALITKRRLLSERVERLLGIRADRSRAVYRHRVGRALVLVLFVPFVLASVFFGNSPL